MTDAYVSILEATSCMPLVGASANRAGRAGEGPREAQRLCGKGAEGRDRNDAVGVEAKQVRLFGVQLSRLN